MIDQYMKLANTYMMLGKSSGELHYIRKARTLYLMVLELDKTIKVVA